MTAKKSESKINTILKKTTPITFPKLANFETPKEKKSLTSTLLIFFIFALLGISAIMLIKINRITEMNLFKSFQINLPKSTTSKTTAPQTTTGSINLSIFSPIDDQIFNTSSITVAGATAANAEVFINDKELKTDSKGNFSTKLTLDEGENIISLVANDAEGNSAEKEITVTYTINE